MEWQNRISMTVRFSYYDRTHAYYDGFFFGANCLIFIVVYVMDSHCDTEVTNLWIFAMGFQRYKRWN